MFKRIGDNYVLPYVHVILVFMHHLMHHPHAMALVERQFPWALLATHLNSLLQTQGDYSLIENEEFPRPKVPQPQPAKAEFKEAREDLPGIPRPGVKAEFAPPPGICEEDNLPRPLPEEFAMRGLEWAENYLPKDWFLNDNIPLEEKSFELSWMSDHRKERILWVARRIALRERWLVYDADMRKFTVHADYQNKEEDVDMENAAGDQDDDSSSGSTSIQVEMGDDDHMDLDDNR